MAYTVTPTRRQLAMAAMLALAVSGGFIRHFADNPSTLRDVGTLLLVLWLPAVGNLIGFLVRKIPRRAPPATEFADASVFSPHLQVRLEPTTESAGMLAALDPATHTCTVIVGRRGFTARLAEPLAQVLDSETSQLAPIEFLHPAGALAQLVPGTDFFLLAGTTAVARGRVVAQSR
ncbi:MAG: hypothetical protein JWP65_1913 [Ramlibacter sp.]|uniref:hypothetical protein n=1 Tax=Ramlibacter sp. TaxID=1917967 RepID=UPI00260B5508|nr:hypothetical protein [Ramlibacter sp.]MDB5751492.1 hypothetical protein [Ramlibacter sp.]